MSSKDLIITLPHPYLREKSRKVSTITDEVRKIIADMKAATLDWEANRPHEVGVALAAIQINQPYKIIAIRNNFDNKKDKTFSVFINPQIIKADGDASEDFEGCLSVKDIYGKVPRFSKVRMKALNESGQSVRVRAEGFLARVIQHEVDHLNGRLFVDYIKGQPDAFYKLAEDGKLISMDYEAVKKADLFR
ncbi:peptide deformylase [Candidatus Saccharibacteria bacterium]|nr:peptide deformylase [Candidatus Saccharibacteria bacterium]